MIKIARFMVVHKAALLDPQSDTIIAHLRGRASRFDFWLDSPLDSALESPLDDDDEYILVEPPAAPLSPQSSPSPRSPPPSPHDPRTIQFSQAERHGRRRTFAEWVTHQVNSFMVRGTRGPMQWMLDLRTYGLKIHYNSTTPGHVTWTGEDELLYKDLAFTMGDFRGFIHGLVGATHRILQQQLLLLSDPAAVPVIPWDRLRDDPTQGKAGWCFLDDSRTRWPVDGATWMTDRLGRADPQLQRFVPSTTGTLSMTAIDQYMTRVVEFREKLSVAIHICSGQPARAPELLSLRHRNTAGTFRNVFIEDGMVAVASKYHKAFYASNDAKIIHRYLPREVGELVVWYLWLVVPFVEQLERYQHQVRYADHPSGPEWTRTVRQWAYIWSPDPRTGREWTSERFREVLKRESGIGLHGVSLNIPAYRNLAIGISRRYLRESSVFPQNQYHDGSAAAPTDNVDDEEGMDPERFIGHIADLQAAHSSHVAGMIYGREAGEQAGTTAHRRELFRLSSTDWHRFLGFADVEDGLARMMGKRACPFDREATQQNHRRRFRLLQADMVDVMQKMTGEANIAFRGNQGPVIQAIQTGVSPIVATMPTGGGKSMFFMLPAFAAGGLTVVVVPLIALRGDMVQRCQRAGISCIEWESRRPPDEASIVLVTPESALGTDFQRFLNRQMSFQRLDRIVIDECHVMLNTSPKFRPMMQRLGRLTRCNTQMIYLTATLPPSAEPLMWERMKVPASTVNLFRSRTRRINVAYRVWRPDIPAGHHGPDQWMQTPTVISFIRDRIRRSEGGRVIIYGHTVPHVTAMAQAIGCEAYFKDQIDRDGVLQRFRETPSAVVVATSALGMGVDIPDIRSIIHIGRLRTLLEYAQESGRAGRDGEASEAIIILPHGMDGLPGYASETSEVERRRVEEYIGMDAHGCRRQVLDRYLDGCIDGYTRTGCGDSNEDLPMAELLCDRCQPDWQTSAEERHISSPVASSTPEATPRVMEVDSLYPDSLYPDSSPPPTPAPITIPPRHRRHSRSPVRRSPPVASVIRRGGYSAQIFGISMSQPDGGDSEDGEDGEAHPIPRAIEQRFHTQDIVRRQPIQAHRGDSGRELEDEEILTQEASQWQERCWSCWRQGRADNHDLFHCRIPANRTAQQFKKTIDAGKIKYAPYTACWRCGMPQSICSGWQPGRNRQPCAYRHVLIPMVSSMLFGDAAVASVRQAWQQRVAAAGYDGQDPGSIVEYFGQAAETNWVQHTELVATFIWLRRLYRAVEGGPVGSPALD
jgi:superfamily II DNA helicase RecQ